LYAQADEEETAETRGERSLRGGVEEFVAVDFCSDADGAVIARLDADNLTLAADIYVAGLCDLLGQGDDEIDGAADGKFCVGEKIRPR